MVSCDPLLRGSAAITEGGAKASRLIVIPGLDPLLCGSAGIRDRSATEISLLLVILIVLPGLDRPSILTLRQPPRGVPDNACHGGNPRAGQGLGAARTPTIACGITSACLDLVKRTLPSSAVSRIPKLRWDSLRGEPRRDSLRGEPRRDSLRGEPRRVSLRGDPRQESLHGGALP